MHWITESTVSYIGFTAVSANMRYFFYIYVIVVSYIFDSFIHVVGHIFSEIYSTGFSGISKVMEIIIEEQLPSCLGDGNSEAGNIFLVVDM